MFDPSVQELGVIVTTQTVLADGTTLLPETRSTGSLYAYDAPAEQFAAGLDVEDVVVADHAGDPDGWGPEPIPTADVPLDLAPGVETDGLLVTVAPSPWTTATIDDPAVHLLVLDRLAAVDGVVHLGERTDLFGETVVGFEVPVDLGAGATQEHWFDPVTGRYVGFLGVDEIGRVHGTNETLVLREGAAARWVPAEG